jgi:hypothetical protein
MRHRASRSPLLLGLFALLVPLVAPARACAQRDPPEGAVKLGGESQMRYVLVRRGAGSDSTDAGLQIRRARLVVTGWFLDPALTFRVRPSYDRATGTLQFDDVWLAYRSGGSFHARLGQYKPEVFREEIISNFSQLAAECSYTASYFGLDYTQALQLALEAGRWRPVLLVHDGAYGANTDFQAGRTALAIAGRLDVVPVGSRASFAGSSGWSDAKAGLLVGVAVDYERGQRRAARSTPDVLKLTADLSAVQPGASALVAVYAQHLRMSWGAGSPLPSALDGADQLGLVAQAGLFAIRDRLELLARYEGIDFGGVYYRNAGSAAQTGSRDLAADRLRIVTVGLNYYLRGDDAKLTLDLQVAADPVPVDNTGAGLLRHDRGNEVAVRSQLQWRF